jgi:hypothetical protein
MSLLFIFWGGATGQAFFVVEEAYIQQGRKRTSEHRPRVFFVWGLIQSKGARTVIHTAAASTPIGPRARL